MDKSFKKALLKNNKKWVLTSIAILGLGLAGGMYFNGTHASATTNVRPTVVSPGYNPNQNNLYPNDGKVEKAKVVMPNKNTKAKVISSNKNVIPKVIMPGKNVRAKVIMPNGKTVIPRVVMPNYNPNKNNSHPNGRAIKPSLILPKNKTVKPRVIMPGGKVVIPTVVMPNHDPNINGTKNGRYNGELVVPQVVIPKHIGQSKHYHHTTITKIAVPKHFRWFMIIKTSLAHNHLMLIGTTRDYKYKLRPHHDITMYINALYRITRRGHSFYQYQVKINGHYYYVTSNDHYTPNAYYQNSDLDNATKRHGTYLIKVIQRCAIYRSTKYNRRTFVKMARRGTLLRTKKIVNIGRSGDYQTRFVLQNRSRHARKLYITSNKNWIKLL